MATECVCTPPTTAGSHFIPPPPPPPPTLISTGTMGGGGPIVIGAAGRAAEYKGGLTAKVLFTAIVAASGGLLFGERSERDGLEWLSVTDSMPQQ